MFPFRLNLLFRVSVYPGLALPSAVKCVVTVLDVSSLSCRTSANPESEDVGLVNVGFSLAPRAGGPSSVSLPDQFPGCAAIGCVLYAVRVAHESVVGPVLKNTRISHGEQALHTHELLSRFLTREMDRVRSPLRRADLLSLASLPAIERRSYGQPSQTLPSALSFPSR